MSGRTRRGTAVRRTIATAALLAAALPAAATAATAPALDVDTNGTAHAAWLQYDGRNDLVQERRRTLGGVLSDAEYVSPAGRPATAPRVGVDGTGDSITAWIGSDGANVAVYSRRRAADGTLSPVQRISSVGIDAYALDLAVDLDGSAVYAWRRGSGGTATVQVRRRGADGVLSTIQTVSTAGEIYTPRVGVDGEGDAVIAWLRVVPGAASGALQVRRRSPDGTLTVTQTVGSVAAAFDLAVNGGGRAVLAWEHTQGESVYILGRTRTTDGTLSPIQAISPARAAAFNPTVAIDSTGRALFGWTRPTADTVEVEGRVRSAAGALGNRFPLAAGTSSIHPEVEVDASGNAVYAWATDAFQGSARRIQARRRTSAGAMSAVQDISTPGGATASTPRLGFDGNGAATIAWTEGTGAGAVVRARRRTAVGELSPIQTLSE